MVVVVVAGDFFFPQEGILNRFFFGVAVFAAGSGVGVAVVVVVVVACGVGVTTRRGCCMAVVDVVVVGVSIGICSTVVLVRPSGKVSVFVMVFIFPFCVIEVRVPARTFCLGCGMDCTGVACMGVLFMAGDPPVEVVFERGFILSGSSSPVFSWKALRNTS